MQGHRRDGGTHNRQPPLGLKGTQDQAEVGNGGGGQSQEMAAVAGMRHGVQRQVTGDGGLQVWVTFRWAELLTGRGGGERVQT